MHRRRLIIAAIAAFAFALPAAAQQKVTLNVVTAGEVDKDTVVAALARANQVISVAARALGLHRTQLYRLMEKYGIARSEDA